MLAPLRSAHLPNRTLAVGTEGEILRLQLCIDLTQPGTVVPEDVHILRQRREESLGMFELIFVGLIQANDDLRDIGGMFQLLDDLRQRGAFQLGIQARQDQCHRTFG